MKNNKEKIYYIAENKIIDDDFFAKHILNTIMNMGKDNSLPLYSMSEKEILKQKRDADEVVDLLNKWITRKAKTNKYLQDANCKNIHIPIELKVFLDKDYADENFFVLSPASFFQLANEKVDSKYVLNDLVVVEICNPSFDMEEAEDELSYSYLEELEIPETEKNKLKINSWAIVSLNEFITALEKNGLLNEEQKQEIINIYNDLKKYPFDSCSSIIEDIFQKSIKQNKNKQYRKKKLD